MADLCTTVIDPVLLILAAFVALGDEIKAAKAFENQ